MPGYLSVTEAMALTPAGISVVGKDFPRRSEAAVAPVLPAYSGTGTRARSWVAPFYNQEAKTVSTLRGLIAAGLYAEADTHIVHIGDSKTNGSGPNRGKAYLDAYPSVFRLMLGAVEGVIPADISASQWDDRWTSGNMRAPYDSKSIGLVPISGNAGPYWGAFASDFAHTGGTFWANAAAGASLTVTVDGGAPQTLTIPSGNGLYAITPTVTGNTQHTYRVESTSVFNLVMFVPTYSTARLKVSRLGRGGSTAAEWVPGHKADGTGLWDTLLKAGAKAVVVNVGTNGVQGTANAADVTAVYAAAAGLNVPVVAVAPGGLGGTGGLAPLADYYPMYDALWDAADLHDIPLVDFQTVVGDFPTSTAAGLLADTVHESRSGYAYEAAALANLLTSDNAPRAATPVQLQYAPTGALAQTMDRRTLGTSSLAALTSGTMLMTAAWLPAGAVVTSATFVSGGSGAAGLTNRWFALFDLSRNLIRATADNTAVWNPGTPLTIPFATTYTVPTDGLYYVGICEVATTPTTLRGIPTSPNTIGLAPILNGTGSTGLTTAASTPTPGPALTVSSNLPYAHVS